MSEQQLITIDGKQYNFLELSEPTQQLLIRAQNGQNALSVLGTTLELARIGAEVINMDLRKLLPEDDGETEMPQGELMDKVVN